MWIRADRPRRLASRRTPNRTALPGLTLVELLAALVILSLVLTLTYGSFFQISNAAMSLKDDLAGQQELRTLLKLVSDDLQAARYLKSLGDVSAPTGIVSRSRNTAGMEYVAVSFHAAIQARFYRQRPQELDPGLHEVGYTVEEDPVTRAPSLVRREDYYVDDNLLEGGVKVVLSRHIETFSLGFLPPLDTQGETQTWDREWDSSRRPLTSRMPSAIRISLGIKGKDGRPLRAVLDINLPLSARVSP